MFILVFLEVYFDTCIDFDTVVFGLHGAVFGSLIVSERLVQQVVGFGVEGCFQLLPNV